MSIPNLFSAHPREGRDPGFLWSGAYGSATAAGRCAGTKNTWVPAFAGMIGVWLAPTLALAHPGHPEGGVFGFDAGLLHPFTGLDHMLAMVSVGLWAALRGGKALWAWPTAFVAALLAGFALGKTGVALPVAEPMIAASIIVLGALTAANARAPTALGVTLIAVFGVAHGYAHGAESPGSTAGFPMGMALATLLLHGAGLAVSLGLQRLRRPTVIRLLGLGAAAGGVVMAVAA